MAAENQVDTIIFDLGGVLIDWNPRYLYRKLFPDDEAGMETFLESICNGEWNQQQDAGRPFAEAVALLKARHPEHADLIEAYDQRWEEMLGGAIEKSVEILAALKENDVPLYALTNWSQEKFPHARERFAFLDWFNGIMVSGEVGMKKPDARIYELLLHRHDIEATSAVFIDDSLRNVDAAQNLGLKGIHFRDPESLRQEIEALGFL